jgi:hypothetical protein
MKTQKEKYAFIYNPIERKIYKKIHKSKKFYLVIKFQKIQNTGFENQNLFDI